MPIHALEKACQEATEAAIGLLKKSQMAFDFSAPNPHDHHVAYSRVNSRGTVSQIKAKGSHFVAPSSGKQEGATMARPIWDTDASLNDTHDIKRRLVAAGFKREEWKVRTPLNPKTKGFEDSEISFRYPLTSDQVVGRTQSLLDAGFNVTWNTMLRDDGHRIIAPTVYSAPGPGKVTILDADRPVGQRIVGEYDSQAEAEKALEQR